MNNKIKELKDEKKNLDNYIKCFIGGTKVEMLLSSNENYKRLKSNIKER